MRYIRIYLRNEDGAPGLALYEIDDDGWVHRQVQMHAKGPRFSPEDILMWQPTDIDYMISHAGSEEIDKSGFEMMWNDVSDKREFCERIPDSSLAWDGWIEHRDGVRQLRWLPSKYENPGRDWMRIPGFERLYIHSDDPHLPRSIHRDIFLRRPIRWRGVVIYTRQRGLYQ